MAASRSSRTLLSSVVVNRYWRMIAAAASEPITQRADSAMSRSLSERRLNSRLRACSRSPASS
ncbi:hypothetical protein [Devosia sp. CAU 1758]